MLDPVPVGRERVDEIGEDREGPVERRQVGQLRADMHVDAGDGDSRQRRGVAIDGAGPLDRYAELVLGLAGGDLGMGQRVDVRVDAQRDMCGSPLRRGDPRQHRQFGLRLDVEAEDVLVERQRQLGLGLADAGKRDPLARHAGGAGAAQLALRHDVHAGALARQRGQDGLVGIGFDRVADERVEAGEGLREDPVVPDQRRRRVAVERRADPIGKCGEVDVFCVEDAVPQSEMVHSDALEQRIEDEGLAPCGIAAVDRRRRRVDLLLELGGGRPLQRRRGRRLDQAGVGDRRQDTRLLVVGLGRGLGLRGARRQFERPLAAAARQRRRGDEGDKTQAQGNPRRRDMSRRMESCRTK